VLETLLSPSWYRVAALRPRVRAHARLHRHRYRDRLWYVLEDAASGRSHRLSDAAYQFVGLMDGQRTTHEIWELACERLGDDGPTQDEAIRLLGLLHAADVLICDMPPDSVELLARRQRRAARSGWRRLANPLAQRVPLWDPDPLLVRALPFVRPFFTRAGAALWCVVVGVALLVGAMHAEALAAGATRDLLEPDRLLRMALAWVAIKAFHEFGHAFAVRTWGGEVHEVGVVFLVFFPVPYVDASAASAIPDKRKRMAVGGAGIAIELFVTALALFAWVLLEPGGGRSFCYDVIWIGGVSTLFFNGNPLLRYDGYFVLADAIEIPNLDARSRQYLAYLAQRHLLGLADVRTPVSAPGEAPWLVGYGVAAFFYRLAVGLGIALFLAGRFLILGTVLAIAAVVAQVIVPLGRVAMFVVASPRVAERRGRAVGVSIGLAALSAVVLGVVPLPSRTLAEGVVWPPEGAEVRAGADGFVVRLLARPDQTVAPGDPLVLVSDPTLDAEVALLAARRREMLARYTAERVANPVDAQIASVELASADSALTRARERSGAALVRSGARGALVLPAGESLVGRFVRRGELLGYVVGDATSSVRVALPHAHVAQVRDRTRGVEVRLSRGLDRALPASIARIVPAATERLPSAALGGAGGGPFAVDPEDAEGTKALDPVFLVDVDLEPGEAVPELGGRAHVRFEHEAEPAVVQGWRALRRLFLKQIGV
jgi:putative peptide zinc metalloprotease protein